MACQLLIVSADPTRRARLEKAFATDPNLNITCSGAEYELFSAPEADVLVIDLAHPHAAFPYFWTLLNFIYTEAQFIAITYRPFDEAAIQTAILAGARVFASCSMSDAEICQAVRIAYHGGIFLPDIAEVVSSFFRCLREQARGTHIEPLQVEWTRRQVFVEHRSIKLTSLESEVLAYFICHESRPISIVELLRQVWKSSPQFGGTVAQVKNCIVRLRQKIEPDPKRPRYLLTAYGHGYYLNTYGEVSLPPTPTKAHLKAKN